jgi:hypothetical protein
MTYVIAVPAEGAVPTPVAMPANCKYPWCTHPEFTTDSSEIGVRASVAGESPGMMHVSHTTLATRYAGGLTEFHDDVDPEQQAQPRLAPIEWSTPIEKHDVGITELMALAKRLRPENLRMVVTASAGTPQRDVYHVEVYRR